MLTEDLCESFRHLPHRLCLVALLVNDARDVGIGNDFLLGVHVEHVPENITNNGLETHHTHAHAHQSSYTPKCLTTS